jgi:hypothetical protein
MQILLNVFGASRQVQRSHDAVDRGIVTAANVVDHVIPHRGDWNAFVTGKLRAGASPATSQPSGRSSCMAIAATSVSTAIGPILIIRSIAHASHLTRARLR